MSTLAQIRDRVELVLADTGNLIYSTAELDEAIKAAVHEYTAVYPMLKEDDITLAADGREVSLSTLTGLVSVVEVWWPYDAADWPPNRVKIWKQVDLAGVPYLYFSDIYGSEPQSGEKVRVWYTVLHTLNGLDSATVSTVRADHENWIVTGAAGKAAMTRVVELEETTDVDVYVVESLRAWARTKLREFFVALEGIRGESARRGVPWLDGFELDKWDSRT